MTSRYCLTCRNTRGSIFYCMDEITGKRSSLKATDLKEVRQMVEAKNQAERQSHLGFGRRVRVIQTFIPS